LGTKFNLAVILIAAPATLLMLVVATAGLTSTIYAQQYTIFAANLSGSNEVPPVTTAGSGIAIFQLVPVGHQQIISYQLNLENISGVTGAHIHSGKQGENGPVVAGLFNPSMSGPPTGAINGQLKTGSLTSSDLTGPLAGQQISALVTMIRSGGAYVNIHTTQNQNGEVRGQIS
jgi:CHRD domain